MQGEDGVGRAPGLGLPAERQVLGWADAQVAQAGVDAVDVGLQQRPLGGVEAADDVPGAGTETVAADIAVDVEQGGPQQGGQLAGRAAALQVHLEEAVLGVEVAQGAGQVGAAAGGDVGHAQGVAGDGDGRVEARQVGRAVKAGQAAAQQQDHRQGGQHDQADVGGHDDQQDADEAAQPAARAGTVGHVDSRAEATIGVTRAILPSGRERHYPSASCVFNSNRSVVSQSRHLSVIDCP